MIRSSKNIVGTGLVAIAVSIVVVGVVWAGTSALQNPNVAKPVSATEVMPGLSIPVVTLPQENDGDLPDIQPGDNLSNEELTAAVARLTEDVSALLVRVAKTDSGINALADDIEDVNTRLTTALDKFKKSPPESSEPSEPLPPSDTRALLEETLVRLSDVEAQTKLLSIDGVYSGTITPAQLSRKLTAADLLGDWPLDRTSGDLDVKSVKAENCWGDSRYNTVLTVDPFRRIVCLRIPK